MRAAMVVMVMVSCVVSARADDVEPPTRQQVWDPVRPAPRHHRDWYAGWMIAADALIVGSAVPVISSLEDDAQAAAVVGYLLAYLASGPVIHGIHGNRAGVGDSLGRRLIVPIAGGLVGFVAMAALFAGSSCGGPGCGLAPVIFGGGGGAVVGAVGAVVWDWFRARVDVPVTPTATATGDGVAFGLIERF